MTDESEPTRDAITTVRELFVALEKGEPEAVVELLHPDIVWKNTSLPDVEGIRWVGAIMRGLRLGWLGFEFDMRHVAADGNVVLIDRIDYLRLGRVRAKFWVAGTYEVRDGRIILWYDHFSLGSMALGILVGLWHAMIRRR
ncbi:limonene-1,2-epoxide hydrolase family protein [Nocardia sp. CNY236]|uniref:limonene-1,2-epoxide hydrolase family protein n=1 Tax=Nocardia sp. CNY236 TaxID=1169152 RepID=UPI000422BF33|nr:limonene-1,2-epoxide hydrolase family protein [Nocardia sp. CNY236]